MKHSALWVLAGVLLLLLFYGGRRAVLPACTFPPGGGTCALPLLLPENRTYDSLSFNLSFDVMPTTPHPWVAVAPSGTRDNYESEQGTDYYEYFHSSLYQVPAESARTYDLEINVTAIGQTDAGTAAYATLHVYRTTVPYPGPGINMCNGANLNCGPLDLIDDNRDTHQVTFRNTLTLLGEATLVSGGAPTGTATLTLPLTPPVYPNLSHNAIIVVLAKHFGPGSTVDTNPPTHLPTLVELRYRETEDPTNVSLRLNTTSLLTLSGAQTAPLTTANFADAANTACQRPSSAAPCTLTLTLESTTAGAIAARSNVLLQAFTPSPQTPTNTTTCGTCMVPINVTCGACPTTSGSGSGGNTATNSTACGTCTAPVNATCGACATTKGGTEGDADSDGLQSHTPTLIALGVALSALLYAFTKTRRRR